MDLETAGKLTKGDWWEGDAAPNQGISVKEFDDLCFHMEGQNEIVKSLKVHLKKEQETLDKMKAKVIAHLESFGKTKHSTEKGTIFITTKFSVKTPKSEDAKALLFAWLKEKGIQMQYLTVNSISLNALYKAELEASGEDFKLPGVDEPTHYQTLTIRSK